MKRFSARVLIALFTFIIGVATFTVWLFLRPPQPEPHGPLQSPHTTAATQESGFASKYENPAFSGGFFYATRSAGEFIMDPHDGYDERELILTYDNKPIKRRNTDAEAPTQPGFYLTPKVRLAFERVEVVGRNVYFKTVNTNGVSYEFSGTSGGEIINTISPSIPVPFISGVLTKTREGRPEGQEEIKFRRDGVTGPKS